MDNYTLIKRNGAVEEQSFFVSTGGNLHISAHISKAEYAQKDTGEVIIYEPLIELFEAVRKAIGKPIPVNSGYRSPAYQKKLYDADLRANGGKPSGAVARPGSSPHETGAAMDLGIPTGWDAAKFAQLIRNTSVAIGFPMARVGWKKYGGRFVHVDLVHMLYAPYTGKPNPNPGAWSPGVVW